MKLRTEYAELGLIIPEEDILTDSEDEFSYVTTGKRGKEIVVGYTRNVEIFWRNHGFPDKNDAT